MGLYINKNGTADRVDGAAGPARSIDYDNTSSGLSSTDVQGAIDELEAVTTPTYTINSDNISVSGSAGSNIYVKRVGNVVNINIVAAVTNIGSGSGGATAVQAVTGLPIPASTYCYTLLTATQDNFNVCALAQLDFSGTLDFYGVVANKKYFGSLTYICK